MSIIVCPNGHSNIRDDSKDFMRSAPITVKQGTTFSIWPATEWRYWYVCEVCGERFDVVITAPDGQMNIQIDPPDHSV